MIPRFSSLAGLLLLSVPLSCGDQQVLGPDENPQEEALARTGVLLVTADLDDGLDELVDETGKGLDFDPDPGLTLRWAGTAGTLLTDLCSPHGVRLDVSDGDLIVISDGTAQVQGTFRASWTLGSLAELTEEALNFVLGTETDIRVEIDGGRLRFVNPIGGNGSSITVSVRSPQCAVFNAFVDAVAVPEGGEGLSDRTRVLAEVVRGESDAIVETLRSGLQAALQLGSPGAEVRFAAGRLVIENPMLSSRDLHDVWLEGSSGPGSLGNAMGLWGTSLRRGETFTTPRKLLTRAVASTPLVDIVDGDGARTGLVPYDEITLSAVVNGRSIDPILFAVSPAGDGSSNDGLVWTVEGLLDEVASVLPVHTEEGGALAGGRIVLKAEPGARISGVMLATDSSPAFEEVFRFTGE